MSYPETYTAFRRTTGDLPNTIQQTQEKLPKELGPNDVVVKIHAVSLNYREHATLIGTYPVKTEEGGIPCSDAAAEVIATGSAVKKFKIGDPVSPITGQGPYEDTDDGVSVAIGFSKPGVLREYAIYEEKHLVHLPKNMSWEDVSMEIILDITIKKSTDYRQGVCPRMRWSHSVECFGRT
jgi:NADPH:quinone reductase-like Zn-dependent oxidoreductase